MSAFGVLLRIVLITAFVYCLQIDANVDLGQCSITCEDGGESTGLSQIPTQPRAPGKRGPKGEMGLEGRKGRVGLKGEPGQNCTCVDVDELKRRIDSIFKKPSCAPWFESEITDIYPNGLDAEPVKALCSASPPPGGWTVIQRRDNGNIKFYRGWDDYANGFGNLHEEFWLGLNNIHALTKNSNMMLRVELEDKQGHSAYAEYRVFKVDSAENNYRLTIGQYSGTAGDSITSPHNNNGQQFSTKNRDNDNLKSINCVVDVMHGAWWWSDCGRANLNGNYSVSRGWNAVIWHAWKSLEGLAATTMKIKAI